MRLGAGLTVRNVHTGRVLTVVDVRPVVGKKVSERGGRRRTRGGVEIELDNGAVVSGKSFSRNFEVWE